MPNPNKHAADHRPADVTPVCLEVNQRGGWMTVMSFDCADNQLCLAVQRSALTLAQIGSGFWRLRTAGPGRTQVLAVLNDVGRGWENARGGA